MIRISSDTNHTHSVPKKAPPRHENRKQKHVTDKDLPEKEKKDEDLIISSGGKIRIRKR